nr:hypothetical protein [Tanacetum cinerariifolium]
MSRDVLTVGSTTRIPLLFRGEYSQWSERLINYLEEQTNGKAMINSIKNVDQPLPTVTQVSIAGATSRLLNEIYSLIDSNKTTKDLWNALERHMLGSEYGEKDRKAVVLYEYETFKATEGELFLETYIRYLQVINDLKKCVYSKDNCDVNDAMKSKKKAVVITSDPLALVAEQTKVSKRKEKVVVFSESEGSDDELKKIISFLAKAFNRKKFYSKPTNNNLRTFSATSSANKKQEYVKSDKKKEEKKVDEKKRYMGKVKCYNCNKERHFAKDCKKAKMEKVLSDSEESSSSKEETIAKVKSNELNEQIKVLIEKNDDFLAQTKAIQEQLKFKHVVIDNHVECQAKYAKLEAERYEYMIRYSAYFENDKQHRKQIVDQEILFNKMIRQLVELDENARMLQNTVLEKDLKIFELDECVRNKDLEIDKCLERLNESKDLRPMLYDERVIGLGYTSRFLIHSDEALKIKKFKRTRENKIEFAYDYFQEIINPDFEKIDSPFQQTSSLKPYVLTVILKKIIIDLEDEVVSLLDKEKENLKIIQSLKSKGYLDTFSSVRRPKVSSVEGKKKGSSNTSKDNLSFDNHSNMNKSVKRYSRKDLMSCNNSHLKDTRSALVCNNAMNASYNARMYAYDDVNDLFAFDD